MIIYLAGSCITQHLKGKQGLNYSRLLTFYDFRTEPTLVVPELHQYRNLIFDSGAFSFFNGQQNINWDAYIEAYCTFINTNNIDLFFEFDIDLLVGIKQVEKYRKKIERLTGKQPIPVWRPSRGYSYWTKMIEQYPYIAISASGMFDSAWCRETNAHKILKTMVRQAHTQKTKVHGLGYTKTKHLKYIGWDSVDSTAWLSNGRFGQGMYQFRDGDICKIAKPKNTRVNYKTVVLHDLNEWNKYQDYAESNL